VKLYTRKGDDGKTHLFGGPRVIKDDPHIEACGAVDELNAWIGVVRAETLPSDVDDVLHRVQHELFHLGAELATPGLGEGSPSRMEDQHVERLEQEIDRFEAQLAPLTEFILPAGVRSAALLHTARTVCRRAERRVVSLELTRVADLSCSPLIRYLNRLGDLFFVLPRLLNARASVNDEAWHK
jgi:cob(I)alamin adenosyltransferase